jgi:iron-sulfur cluster repair protein YtfE (RIC family)
MTVLDTPTITPVRFRPVMLDLYRGIHKGIRAELFAVVGEAGRVDPSNDCSLAALSEQLRSVAHLLEHHAATEDQHIGPVLEQQVPRIAEQIEADHQSFEGRVGSLCTLADEVRAVTGPRNDAVHELYVELASFTSAYLAHQDLEERVINPTLEDTIGFEGMLSIHNAIVGTMEPQELIAGLSVMLPAMNVDDRTGLLGGIKAHAPAPAWDGVWSLAGSVLVPADYQAVAQRLGLG